MSWEVTPTVHTDKFGIFSVVVSAPYRTSMDITFFRNVPAIIQSMTYADPFSDSTATIEFPQITPYDDPTSSKFWWLNPWTNYDIYWVPATTTKKSDKDVKCINPLTNKKDLWLNFNQREVLWEGYSVSVEPTDKSTVIQLQGALFQLDRYIAFPKFPPRPVANEKIIERLFSGVRKPLRIQQLQTVYPNGWSKTFTFPTPSGDYANKKAYYPFLPTGLAAGAPWSGLATRNTGSTSSRILTGFTQELLGTMYTDVDCGAGIPAGDQWTIRKDPGRIPVLYVRSSVRAPDFEIWYGLPGVEIRMTLDGLTTTNVIYGEGTNEDNNPWSNSVISPLGDTTTQVPLAYDEGMYPYVDKISSNVFPSEGFYNMGSGVTMNMGIGVARHMLQRDGNPGWLGDITLKVDPNSTMSKWSIRPGMTVKVKGFMGAIDGMNFHIAEVTLNPTDGSVALRVDSKYRDLLSIEQVRAAVRDPMTPSKMLQVNRRQYAIDDMVRPWNYGAGSGFVPEQSVFMHKRRTQNDVFPWTDNNDLNRMVRRFPPNKARNATMYVTAVGSRVNTKARWSKPTRILTAQKFEIRRMEFIMVDGDGKLITTHPFHVSIYTRREPSLPRTGSNYSPFLENHFESLAPDGRPWGPMGANQYAPDNSILWGVGNFNSKGGYWPNQSNTPGAAITGMLVDETPWSYDQSDNPNFQKSYNPNRRFEKMTNTDIWLLFYTDYPGYAYLHGRLYRKEPS